MEILKLGPSELRWKCDESMLDFETTGSVDPASRIVGQETAREALIFGILCDAPGQNVYVRGARGTGRLTMVRRLLEELAPTTEKKRDYCYVHNFRHPDRPRLVTPGPGTARSLAKRITELARFVDDGLGKALDSEPYASKLVQIRESIQQRISEISAPLEKDLADNNMALVSVQQGPMSVPVIVPLVAGSPVPPEKFMEMVANGNADESQLDKFKKLYPDFQKRLQETGKLVNEEWRRGARETDAFKAEAARGLLEGLTEPILSEFGSGGGVREFIEGIVADAVENRLAESDDEDQQFDLTELYGVNVLLTHGDSVRRPVVVEPTPSAMNLLGTVDQKWGPGGVAVSDYRGIRAGALLMADQGYLILEVEDLITEPGAWQSLMRTLRTGRLEIVPPESGWMRPYVVVQPEPIEIRVRVILIGDVATYYKLDYLDSDFRELFKVLADFDDQLPRDADGVMQYAAVISHLAREESLPPFDQAAVAALVEHGARIASRNDKLTAKFGRIADISREAAFLATRDGHKTVGRDQVVDAVRRTKERASLPSRKFQELVENGTLIVETDGEVVGQVNGLAVMHAGPLTYGFPARVTAAIGPGRAGLINIEGTARMSGSIHTKGFHILGGLLMNLLKLPHPLAFTASLAFEQSYGGIDGDSASGAEMVCLLSALTDIPIHQGMAMTGAIDQHGHIEAIGGVNEKIEGFFDVCRYFGLTGKQGVVIPRANAADLMLRHDVVAACRDNQFAVYAVETIHQAIELMTGLAAGQYGQDGFPAGTLLAMAVDKAGEYWRRTLSSPDRLTTVRRELADATMDVAAATDQTKG